MDTGADDVGGAAIGVAGGGASAEFSVDEAKPTTNVRVRLATGKRQVLKFNTTHTVGDLLAQVARYVDGIVLSVTTNAMHVAPNHAKPARDVPPRQLACGAAWRARRERLRSWRASRRSRWKTWALRLKQQGS